MHDIEPYYNWRGYYVAAEDPYSPFFEREYSEFEFSSKIYNYYIHPQWDDFGSRTLYLKILYADYEQGHAVLELIGEWNDAIENDIMTLKREVVDGLIAEGVRRFVLVAENVLNFHSSDASYYEEWVDDIREEEGWVVVLNMPGPSQQDFRTSRLTRYVELLEYAPWRTLQPQFLVAAIDELMPRRLGGG